MNKLIDEYLYTVLSEIVIDYLVGTKQYHKDNMNDVIRSLNLKRYVLNNCGHTYCDDHRDFIKCIKKKGEQNKYRLYRIASLEYPSAIYDWIYYNFGKREEIHNKIREIIGWKKYKYYEMILRINKLKYWLKLKAEYIETNRLGYSMKLQDLKNDIKDFRNRLEALR
jgi:hypothetical protein